MSGTVRIEPSAWGTRVTLTVELADEIATLEQAASPPDPSPEPVAGPISLPEIAVVDLNRENQDNRRLDAPWTIYLPKAVIGRHTESNPRPRNRRHPGMKPAGCKE